jgi:tRNA G10  N-methylase Trm11
MDELYLRAFQSMSKLLKKGGRVVVGLSNKDFISLGEKYFSLIEKHVFKVHKSLIRYFVVYEK